MRPLNTGWRIFADDLPARLTESEPDTAFHLPGADALAIYGPIIQVSTFVQCCAYSIGQRRPSPLFPSTTAREKRIASEKFSNMPLARRRCLA